MSSAGTPSPVCPRACRRRGPGGWQGRATSRPPPGRTGRPARSGPRRRGAPRASADRQAPRRRGPPLRDTTRRAIRCRQVPRTVLAGPSHPATNPQLRSTRPPDSSAAWTTPSFADAWTSWTPCLLDPPLLHCGCENLFDVHLSQHGQVREGGIRQGYVRRAARRPACGRGSSAVAARSPRPAGCRSRPGTQALQGAGVHDHRAGRAKRRGSALHNAHRGTVVMCLQSGREPRGSGTDDQHVRTRAHAAATTRHHAAFSSVDAWSSSTLGSSST